jgi:hypothetical protein
MDDTAKARAEALTADMIAAGPYEDFREPYRERLRWLKETRPEAFSQALQHYETLVERIAGGNDAIREWLVYGRQLGELSGAGKVTAIDQTGRSVNPTGAAGEMLLHLPNEASVPALALAIPRDASAAQRAAYDLLVRRKLALE